MSQPGPPTPVEGAGTGKRRMPLGRAWNRFLDDPASGRNAIVVIVGANLLAVLIGAVAIWLVDRKEYARLADAVWYTLQTVTTVGYGDVTPADPAGRLIGGAVMLLAIASLSVLTALIASAFIEARQATRSARENKADDARWTNLEARLDAVIERLDRLDRLGPGSAATRPDEP